MEEEEAKETSCSCQGCVLHRNKPSPLRSEKVGWKGADETLGNGLDVDASARAQCRDNAKTRVGMDVRGRAPTKKDGEREKKTCGCFWVVVERRTPLPCTSKRTMRRKRRGKVQGGAVDYLQRR